MLKNRNKSNCSKRLVEEEPNGIDLHETSARLEQGCVACEQNKIRPSNEEETQPHRCRPESFRTRCTLKMNQFGHWVATWIFACCLQANDDCQSNADSFSDTQLSTNSMSSTEVDLSDRDGDICGSTTCTNEIAMQQIPRGSEKSHSSFLCAKRGVKVPSKEDRCSKVSMSDVLGLYRATRNNHGIPLDPPSWVAEVESASSCGICFVDSKFVLPCCGSAMCGRCINVWWLHSATLACPLCNKEWPHKEKA